MADSTNAADAARINRVARYAAALFPYLLISLAVLSWAGNWVLGRGMRNEIGPVAMGFWRWTLALALILPFCWSELRTKWPVVRRHWWQLTLLGILGAVVFNTMVYVGLQYTETTNSALFNSIVPIYIVVLSWLFLGERISLRQGIGITLSVLGVLIIVTRGNPLSLLEASFNVGEIWIVVAMLLWAIYTILLRWRPRELSAIAFLGAMLLLSLPTLLPFYGWELYQRGTFQLSASTVGTLVYYATVPSAIAYLMWNRGVAQVGPTRAGHMSHLLPVFTVILAVVFLDERLYPFHYLGAACVFLGIGLTTWQPE
ncbi:MAG: DMT family transporter [Betaproteobacteria bacterium]|nr:MAG: DMT family transporter [Betaproteobacteria bacterium]